MLGPSAANSHQTRWQRRQAHARRPVLGVLGCMAERLKGQLLETDKLVDLVAGPDAYRDLPRLIAAVQVKYILGTKRHPRKLRHF